MKGTHLIEIAYKPRVTDPVGKNLAKDIVELRLGKIKDVRTGQLYRLVGELQPEQWETIARNLLCDPVVQDYSKGHVAITARSKHSAPAPVVVDVWYKAGVTDVVGESVLKGIKDLAVASVSEVRTGTRYRFTGISTKEAAQKLALALLANPLVHDYVIHAQE
jgi:phosphoribosylformylglycinamidine (FGAM) synthase PurS component